MQKILLIGAFVAISCLLMAQGPVKNYQNPVVNYSLPDPSVIKGEDGYYYLYATEDIRNLPIHRSKDLVEWEYVGTAFTKGTRPDFEPKGGLWAPDINKIGDKYVLYYSMSVWGGEWTCGIGCATADKPEGPFKLLSQYKYDPEDAGDDGIYNDAGVLVDDDGRVYIYYGFTESNFNEIDPADMYTIKNGSYKRAVIDDSDNAPQEQRFFEASSPRKIGDTYYLIYSPCVGSRLAYATSDKPQGPFKYRGYIIDNGVDYPGGNDHGSVCNINGQWYIFYHRMTNNTIMSRRACVEKIEILPDGTIPTVEMTSLGFEDSLDPFKPYPADIACVLKGGCFITEKDIFTRSIVNITHGNIIGYKYFDFGEDFSSKTMKIALKVRGMGTVTKVAVYADDYENSEPVGYVDIGTGDGVYTGVIKSLTGRHSIYFVPTAFSDELADWIAGYFKTKPLFELEEFVFLK